MSPLQFLAPVLVWLALTPVLFIGAVGAATAEGPIRLVFVAMVLAGLLGMGGSAWNAWQAVQAARLQSRRTAAVQGQTAGVLARWSLGSGEGRASAEREWSERWRQVVTIAAAVFILGGALLHASQGGPGWIAALASGLFAGLYAAIGLAKYGLEYAAATSDHEVIVWPDAVRSCGTWHNLTGDRELLGVTLGETLDFKVQWQTRGGMVSDTIRVPVPAEHRGDAEGVVRFFWGAPG